MHQDVYRDRHRDTWSPNGALTGAYSGTGTGRAARFPEKNPAQCETMRSQRSRTGSRSTGEPAGTSGAGQAEHPREPRPAPSRDRCAIARHRGRCRKASHTVALNRRVSTSRAMPRDPQDIAISPARAISTRPPELAHSGAPGISHVRDPVSPGSRTHPANFPDLKRSVGIPDREAGAVPARE